MLGLASSPPVSRFVAHCGWRFCKSKTRRLQKPLCAAPDVVPDRKKAAATWVRPLRYFFSSALPAANFVAIYSDLVVDALPLPTVRLLGGFLRNALSRQVSAKVLQTALSFLGVVFPFVILPLMDRCAGRDTSDPSPDASLDGRYRWPLYLYVPLHLTLLFCALTRASALAASPVHYLGVVLGLGICGGLGFTVAHELIHGRSRFDAFLRDVLLCLFCYMHYAASHIAHHIKVGTRDDAGTGRFNESFYAFFPRAVYMSVRDGLWMERKRLRGHQQSLMSPQNNMWKWLLAPLALYSSIFAFFGPSALIVMSSQAVLAVISLEVVNYIEHYGLTRSSTDGKLQAVTSAHSWNADWGGTSALIFELQRHADHHNQSTLPYQALRSLPEAPAMPMSYPGMMMLALIPPLYFRVMNPRILESHAAP